MTEKDKEIQSDQTIEAVAPSLPFAAEFSLNCAACGVKALRGNAKFCFTCGKLLKEDYMPLDSLRASNRLQGRSFTNNSIASAKTADLYQLDKNSFAQTAWASCVYSMVPYLGILFIPFTIIFACFGIGAAYRNPNAGGKKIAVFSIALSFGVLVIQTFLWALLYIIPKIGAGM